MWSLIPPLHSELMTVRMGPRAQAQSSGEAEVEAAYNFMDMESPESATLHMDVFRNHDPTHVPKQRIGLPPALVDLIKEHGGSTYLFHKPRTSTDEHHDAMDEQPFDDEAEFGRHLDEALSRVYGVGMSRRLMQRMYVASLKRGGMTSAQVKVQANRLLLSEQQMLEQM